VSADRPKSIERLAEYAARVGAPVKIEPTDQGYRLLMEARADPVLDDIIVRYVEEELQFGLAEDVVSAPPGWRRLGIIVGYQEVND
jgi:hypothetical protein